MPGGEVLRFDLPPTAAVANLTGADLTGANLTDANLTRADLTRASFSDDTRWPGGFDPAMYGMIRR